MLHLSAVLFDVLSFLQYRRSIKAGHASVLAGCDAQLCTGSLLMGFRSSSECSDNGTMEELALTILHLRDATIDHQFSR